jgi:putative ABC transport system permease protein
MALGAAFAALNSTYSSVANRTVEFATLRAFGFGAGAITLAVLSETLLLALAGAAAGTSLAYAAFQGSTVTTLGGALFDSQLVYSLAVTPDLVASATVVACVLGLVGGLQPAAHAAQANIAIALQEG